MARYKRHSERVFDGLSISAWRDSKGLSFLFGFAYIFLGVGFFFGTRLMVSMPERYDPAVYVRCSLPTLISEPQHKMACYLTWNA